MRFVYIYFLVPTNSGELLEVQAGAGLTQQVQTMVEQLGAGSRVQVLQLLHGDLWLHVHNAEDERRVLDLKYTKRRRSYLQKYCCKLKK